MVIFLDYANSSNHYFCLILYMKRFNQVVLSPYSKLLLYCSGDIPVCFLKYRPKKDWSGK